MNMELLLGAIIEPNIDKNASIFPWNHFKILFYKRLMQFEKQIQLFLSFEELDIQTELYL